MGTGREEEAAFERVESASGCVFVNPAFAEAVEGLSLRRFAEAMRFVGGELVDSNRKRSVARVEWKGRRYFLKRFTRPPAKDALFQILRLRAPRTHAGVEREMAEALRSAGIGAPEVAAYGEASGRWLKRPSFLLTAELEGYAPLDAYLSGRLDRYRHAGERRSLARDLGSLVRRMHDAGICAPDLYAHHVFVREGESGRSFALIDLHRARRRDRISLFDAVRDLSGLHLTLPRGLASRTDRLRFLRAYFGGGRLKEPARRLAAKLHRRARRIGSRKRFSPGTGPKPV